MSLASTGGACGLAVSRAVCALDPLPAGRDALVTFSATVSGDAGAALVANAQVHTAQSDVDPDTTNDRAAAQVPRRTVSDDVTEADRPVRTQSAPHSEPDSDAP